MLVEYSIVFPLAVLLSIGFADAARLFWTMEDASGVTAEVARCGAIDQSGRCPNLVAYAQSIAHPLAPVTYSSSITTCGNAPAGSPQTGILVTANIQFDFMIPVPGIPNMWTVSTCYARST